MRLILMMAIVLPLAALCQGKKKLPVFGKIDKEELASNTCTIDKEAEAFVIFETAKQYYDISGSEPYSELRHHVRLKILKEDGRKHAEVKVRYEAKLNQEGIFGITANTYNLDESGNIVVSKVEKSAIYQKKLNSRFSEIAFTFPDVKAGSIIEYKYTWRGYRYRTWKIQKSIPVVQSRYEIDFPVAFEVHTRPFCSLPFSSTDESTSLRTVKVFSMENIPGMKDEEFMTCKEDYMQRVESWITAFHYQGRRYPFLKTWPQMAKLMLEDESLGMQLKKDIPRTAELDSKLQTISDPYTRMATIHQYVRNYMTWDGYDNFWAANGVKSAWKERVGTSGEINLILINLLRDAGLKVFPVMVSTRENGRVSPFYPDYSQFNKVLAYVEIGEKKYVLDGTNKITPSNMIPYDVVFSEGMVLDPAIEHSFRWVELWDAAKLEKNYVLFQAGIDNEGRVKGHATVTSFDYARIKRVPGLTDKEKFKQKYFQNPGLDLVIDSFLVKNDDKDSLPLIQDVDFHGTVNNSGDYGFFATNLFAGFSSNPFIADQRFSDVFFGTNQSHVIVSTLRIPEGYKFEELPKNMKMTLEDQSVVITRISQATGNIVNTRITVDFKKPMYTPEEYPDLKEFYKKMYGLLEEQIVFKKS